MRYSTTLFCCCSACVLCVRLQFEFETQPHRRLMRRPLLTFLAAPCTSPQLATLHCSCMRLALFHVRAGDVASLCAQTASACMCRTTTYPDDLQCGVQQPARLHHVHRHGSSLLQ
ncbi:hypothetical protein COO60DRAFT_1555456 [Scenedesmus sp. NREL 46B-D3]|nr:hypothetical protein COO60DRAFT_1555456 [Scenedesmus sp. NREL 46B-D3]